jgi:hypothetical protein
VTAERFRAVGRTRAAAGSLSRQFGLLIALAVVPVLIALGITTFLMILSGHEAVLVGLIVLAVAAAALGAKLITNGSLGTCERSAAACRRLPTATGRSASRLWPLTSWPSWPARPTR